MTKKERAKIILEMLNHTFPHPSIPLSHHSSFTLLIAVLLSAQCTDQRVNTITPLLFEKASTPEKMATLPIETIETIIRPCGLAPTKARFIKELSKILIETYDGEVPDSLEALETLPGVGHKTASVVMVQAFNQSAFPIDTHIHRCAKRWGLSKGRTVVETEKDLKQAFDQTLWGKVHLQIIYFARAYCPARGHQVSECPICNKLVPNL